METDHPVKLILIFWINLIHSITPLSSLGTLNMMFKQGTEVYFNIKYKIIFAKCLISFWSSYLGLKLLRKGTSWHSKWLKPEQNMSTNLKSYKKINTKAGNAVNYTV